jgi:hypothetical protein
MLRELFCRRGTARAVVMSGTLLAISTPLAWGQATTPAQPPPQPTETDIGRVTTAAGQGENVTVVPSATTTRAAPLEMKQEAPNIIEVQPLSEMIKLPDVNLAEALQRIRQRLHRHHSQGGPDRARCRERPALLRGHRPHVGRTCKRRHTQSAWRAGDRSQRAECRRRPCDTGRMDHLQRWQELLRQRLEGAVDRERPNLLCWLRHHDPKNQGHRCERRHPQPKPQASVRTIACRDWAAFQFSCPS